jgi:hypothetical protein
LTLPFIETDDEAPDGREDGAPDAADDAPSPGVDAVDPVDPEGPEECEQAAAVDNSAATTNPWMRIATMMTFY